MIMIFHDTIMVVTSSVLFLSTAWFFYLTALGLKLHSGDDITYHHFLEHSIAAAFVAIGALFLIVEDVVHLFGSAQDKFIEFPQTLPELLLRVGVALFLFHMIKEQTPNHPFYIREYGEQNKTGQFSNNDLRTGSVKNVKID